MRRVVFGMLLSGIAIPTFASAAAQSGSPETIYYADAYADHYGVSRALVHAIIAQESNWNPLALSDKGAAGLMQLMPETAKLYGVRNRYSVTDSLSGGVQYLADLLRRFRGDARLAVAAYYCGAGQIDRQRLSYGNTDVVAYVESVRHRYQRELREEAGRGSLLAGGR
jgi:soluble lytic murein transglycosylase-like protein